MNTITNSFYDIRWAAPITESNFPGSNDAHAIKAPVGLSAPDTTVGADTQSTIIVRHERYFFEDGNMTFLICNVLYRVHSHFFDRESTGFDKVFAQLRAVNCGVFGHASFKLDFPCGAHLDSLLWYLYESHLGKTPIHDEITTWCSLLYLAHQWQFKKVFEIAREKLRDITFLNPVDKIQLSIWYEFPAEWALDAYIAIGRRKEPLSLQDASRLPLQVLIGIHNLQELFSPGTPAKELKKFILKTFSNSNLKTNAYDHLTPSQQASIIFGVTGSGNVSAYKRKADQENDPSLIGKSFAPSNAAKTVGKENTNVELSSKRPKLFDATNKDFQQNLIQSISQELRRSQN